MLFRATGRRPATVRGPVTGRARESPGKLLPPANALVGLPHLDSRHLFATESKDKAAWLLAGKRMLDRGLNGPKRVRTLFLSDVHLGSRGCQAERLLDFLRNYETATLYLVGDIVDGWQLKSAWYWPQFHNDVVQKLLRQVRKGVRLLYIPGNHDEFLRDYYGTHFGGIEVIEDAVHIAADGKRYLVVHGDLFDVVIRHARWLALLGDKAYDFAIWLNTHFNAIRRAIGLPYWSLSQWAKLKVKNAVNFIGEYERTLTQEARRRGVDGVICGHIHHAAIRSDFGLHYINCGDWVESCTAVVEHFDGQFEIIRWIDSGCGRQDGSVVPFELAAVRHKIPAA
jgi:UDP-2,3-diacylglucosamine pyrophosphatase LpxH